MLPWTKKYAPKTFDELLFPPIPALRARLADLFDTGHFPYPGLILEGVGGTGKSTLINLLSKQEWVGTVITLNSSGQNKSDLDSLKNALGNHPGAFGKHLVLGNEIIESSSDYINGLRGLMDDYSNDAFFAFTDNHYANLCVKFPQLFSNQRVRSINFNTIAKTDIKECCMRILKAEGKDNPTNEKILDICIKDYYPSIRAIIEDLEFQV
jgi:DNA polymerase III delta prime subunit